MDSSKYTIKLQRIPWVDICKGLTIILMILGNISDIPYSLRIAIFSFHMPLFMVVNGYLLHDYNIKSTFIKSVKTLIIPYVVVCLIESILYALSASDIATAGTYLFDSLDDMIVGMSKISTMFIGYNSVWLIWFVACLFIARNLYVMIRSLSKNLPIPVQYTIVLAVSFTGAVIGTRLAFLPWSLDVAMVSVVFIAFGDFLKKNRLRKKIKLLMTIFALGFWIVLIYNKVWIELAMRRYTHDILSIICAILGSIVIMAVSRGLERIPGISGFLSWSGKNSIVILAVHCFEMRFFKWDKWIYNPIKLKISWFPKFLIHAALILVLTEAFIICRAQIRKFNNKLKEKHSFADGKRYRIAWVDVAKGICIISVIIGHMGIDWINRIVFVYHLPVFFIIAGYFIKKKDDLLLVKMKAKRLLCPYLITSLVICVIAVCKAFIKGASKSEVFFKWLDATLYGAGDNWEKPFKIQGIGAIWFLWAMFFALIIVNHFVEKKYYQVIILSIAFIGWASFNETQLWLPLSIQSGMLASIYLLIGYECKKYMMTINKIGIIPLVCMSLVTALGIQHFKGIWLVHNYFGNGWLDFFVTITASTIIIALSDSICKNNELLKYILEFFGRNSLLILCAHIIEINVLNLSNYTSRLSDYIGLNNNHSIVLLIFTKILYVAIIAGSYEYYKRFVSPKLSCYNSVNDTKVNNSI